MSDTVTIRFTKEEKKIFENSAKLYDCSISAMIKRLALDKLEDEIDLSSIKEYEVLKKNGKLKTRPINKLWEEVGLDD